MTLNANYKKKTLTPADYELIYRMKSAADEVQKYHLELSINYQAADSQEHTAMVEGLRNLVSDILELKDSQRPLASFFIANTLKCIYDEMVTEGVEKSSWLNLSVISMLYIREEVVEMLREEKDQFIGYVMGVFINEVDPDPSTLAAVFQAALGDIVGADIEYNLFDNLEEIVDMTDNIDREQIGRTIVNYIHEMTSDLESFVHDSLGTIKTV